jgi:peptidoglycan hydrolase-like protein with peptidoglycan-binding domain
MSVALLAALAVFAPAQSTTTQSNTKATGAKQSTKSAPAKSASARSPAAQPTTTKSTLAQSATKSTLAKSTTGKAAPPASTSTGTSAAKRTLSKTGVKQSPSPYHPAQQQPTPDRYKEIQQALADRGYFGGPVDGNWGPSSLDALKRFQHDQNLIEDGKVGSLSLIALGLGPKRGSAGATSAPKASPLPEPPPPYAPLERPPIPAPPTEPQ